MNYQSNTGKGGGKEGASGLTTFFSTCYLGSLIFSSELRTSLKVHSDVPGRPLISSSNHVRQIMSDVCTSGTEDWRGVWGENEGKRNETKRNGRKQIESSGRCQVKGLISCCLISCNFALPHLPRRKEIRVIERRRPRRTQRLQCIRQAGRTADRTL